MANFVEVRGFEPLTPCMTFRSVGFSGVHTDSGSPNLQGFWFIRVHTEPHEFKIFADGNADILQ